MRVVLVSDTGGLGLMDARPEPAWRVRFSALRNKDLLAPDYGMMHVAAAMKASGRDFEVVNVVADLHREASLFVEPGTYQAAMSGSPISEPGHGAASKSYLFDSL